ncbi:MAG: sigma-70 family RNA polymerase sigma factor [Clostridium sp.]|nr:sigma-70 family RNA polymerase sigma factor [Clostridium sp.]MDU7085740.1 sigma-70 family RNA polymerase sigma factor [Clostridium sp.]
MNNILSINEELINNQDEYKQIKKAIDGDKNAFAEIIKLNKVHLYKTAYMYVKNEDKALDVLQETISKGLISIHKLKTPAYFNTWITRILINTAIDMNRKYSKTEELNEHSKIIDFKASVSLEEKLDLYRAVDLLKDNYKTIIIMKYFNDMKIKEISEVMNIPENTVKTYLNRAKTSLRDILKEGYLND